MARGQSVESVSAEVAMRMPASAGARSLRALIALCRAEEALAPSRSQIGYPPLMPFARPIS